MSLPVDARREDNLAQGDFSRWIVKQINRWFVFARDLGLGIELMEEIILGTGCDHARSSTNVVFFGSQALPLVLTGNRYLRAFRGQSYTEVLSVLTVPYVDTPFSRVRPGQL